MMCAHGPRGPGRNSPGPPELDHRRGREPDHVGHIRQTNPRILAIRAYDFVLWMGIIAELPRAFGEMRGAA
jgi:hypothetical protein